MKPSINDQIKLSIATYLNRLGRYEEAREELKAITNPEAFSSTDQTLIKDLLNTMPLLQLSCEDFSIEKLFGPPNPNPNPNPSTLSADPEFYPQNYAAIERLGPHQILLSGAGTTEAVFDYRTKELNCLVNDEWTKVPLTLDLLIEWTNFLIDTNTSNAEGRKLLNFLGDMIYERESGMTAYQQGYIRGIVMTTVKTFSDLVIDLYLNSKNPNQLLILLFDTVRSLLEDEVIAELNEVHINFIKLSIKQYLSNFKNFNSAE